jgi:glycosyltransferase involved in cell wall biosynthesis
MENKEKILVVIPTTASRLSILQQVVDSVYSNDKFDIKTVIVKNGTYSDDEFLSYDFKYPNVIKTKSTPGGHLAKAMNKGLEYLTDEDWFLYQEDDLIIHDDSWLSKIVELYNSIPKCGVFGTRLHGAQRRYNPQMEYTIESLKAIDKNTFETYWTDGITLVKGSIMKKHNIKYDENMMTVPNADLNLQMLENGYENWRTELNYTHHHTPGSKTGTAKWAYADVPVDMKEGDCKIYLKYNGYGNPKIQEWVDIDTQVAAKWLKENNRDKESYKTFKL